MRKDCRTCKYHSGHMILSLVEQMKYGHSCSYEFDSKKEKGLEVNPLMIKRLKNLKSCENYSYNIRYDDEDMKDIRLKLEKRLVNEGME